MSSTIHIPKPGAIGLIVDRNPTWCGRAHGAGTLMTVFEHLATCRRCIKANRLYREEVEYQRVKARRESEEATHAS